MFIVHIKTRGKIVRTPSGEMVRTPRKIEVRNEKQLNSMIANMRAQCIYDYEIAEEKDGTVKLREASKRMKYSSADTSINISGKIGSHR